MKNKVKHYLETILIICDIQGSKNINVICKVLLSWVVRKQEFDRRQSVLWIFPFFLGICFNENDKVKLVVDNGAWKEFLQEFMTQLNLHKHDFSMHFAIFPAYYTKRKNDF